jgi:hypothetical protein
VRAIFSSGYTSDGGEKDPEELRAKAILQKPFESERLLKTIRRILDEA